MPIRIMHVVSSLGTGGLENGLVNLIGRMDPTRFEHVVYAVRRLGENAGRLSKDGVRVICLGTDSSIQVPALVRGIRQLKPHIVHSRNWGAIEAVIAAKLLRGCAVVHSEHGLEAGAGAKEPRRRIWFRRLAYQLADRVLSVSYQLRDLHARRTGFPEHRISVIHNGVDGRRFFSDPAARAGVRKELGISEKALCIGCVGNLFPVKDHMTVLRAVARLAETSVDWRLLMIGAGPELSSLRDFVDAHPQWRHRVSFLGATNRVPLLLKAMDIYVLCSAAEGISNSLLEAMATGLPAVVTNTGGNPEVVVEGKSGLLFPVGDFRGLADHLLLLQAKMDLRVQLGGQALRRVSEEFSIDSMVRKYEQVYESLAAPEQFRASQECRN